MSRLAGGFEMTQQDQGDLNWNQGMNNHSGIPSQCTVATSFLRRNQHLVE